MSHIAYYRVSNTSQSIQSQKAALTHADLIEHEYMDEGVSGAVVAANRPGFAELLRYIRKGDTLHVYAVDRLGRDAIDVQTTIRALLEKGVTLEINGLGQIGKGVGELIVAVLAQVADMERQRIILRTTAGRELAKTSLAATGKTHRGKESLGRPVKADAAAVKAWRTENTASISQAAKHFGLSDSTVKRYCAAQA
ncbi:putative DNA-invertase from lambdoid prophage Rac [Janthinobacterium sp. TND4EL3]|uniref:recombinase family protein n=1 Tax=Janthinobacterium sp. TND4EL3 TaxID=1907311 RepID=UPI000953ECD3|nr:recombinase family protein [Janthinobacterium sp. TND4EL3]SIQ92544.1 putative DNA-invertase from lambdoid prophage Rac [Janthinobacterium sp. TND4EL3]